MQQFNPELDISSRLEDEAEDDKTVILVHTSIASKMYFLSLLIENNLSLGQLMHLISKKAGKSFEDEQEVRKGFKDFLCKLNPKKFNKPLSTKRERQQKQIEEMYNHVRDAENGWSQEEVHKLYELFEEVQQELEIETE